MTTPGTRSRSVEIPAALTVKDLGDILGISAVDVIKRLMTRGVLAAMNQTIDYDTAATVAVGRATVSASPAAVTGFCSPAADIIPASKSSPRCE